VTPRTWITLAALVIRNLGQKSRLGRKMGNELQRADQTEAVAGTEPVSRGED
jgi:hypothetical protein